MVYKIKTEWREFYNDPGTILTEDEAQKLERAYKVFCTHSSGDVLAVEEYQGGKLVSYSRRSLCLIQKNYSADDELESVVVSTLRYDGGETVRIVDLIERRVTMETGTGELLEVKSLGDKEKEKTN